MNFDHSETLLKLVEEVIEKPLTSLDYNQPLEEVIKELDGYVDEYLLMAKKLVEVNLMQAYYGGVDDATSKLNDAVEQHGIDYKLIIPDMPEKLQFLIDMHQRNIEDYALVLRGRLRSAIEAKAYMD
jgi:hypothetical protein